MFLLYLNKPDIIKKPSHVQLNIKISKFSKLKRFFFFGDGDRMFHISFTVASKWMISLLWYVPDTEMNQWNDCGQMQLIYSIRSLRRKCETQWLLWNQTT